MSKTIAILQSNYIPWKGYFNLINQVDEFVLYDEVQYTRSDWRNRNRIKSPTGSVWLTIPVQGNHLQQKIRDVQVCDTPWARTHWRTISQTYARAPYFKAYKDCLEETYLGSSKRYLSEINHEWIALICRLLGVTTPITWSAIYPRCAQDRTDRLIEICRQAGADTYLSGPAARAYLDEHAFARAGIALNYVDYAGYPEYPQLHPPFDHFVSVLDLILMHGSDAVKYMKTFEIRSNGHEPHRNSRAG